MGSRIDSYKFKEDLTKKYAKIVDLINKVMSEFRKTYKPNPLSKANYKLKWTTERTKRFTLERF